jgi:hypothetical protein
MTASTMMKKEKTHTTIDIWPVGITDNDVGGGRRTTTMQITTTTTTRTRRRTIFNKQIQRKQKHQGRGQTIKNTPTKTIIDDLHDKVEMTKDEKQPSTTTHRAILFRFG